MLETKVTCTCQKCGIKFEKVVKGRTAKELKSKVSRAENYYRFCAPCYSCEKPAPRVEVTCPYWIYKEYLHYYCRKPDSYSLLNRTVVLLVKESQVEKVKAIIAKAGHSEKAKQEDEKNLWVSVLYADLKNNIFGDRIVKTVKGTYDAKHKAITVVARNADDCSYISRYYIRNGSTRRDATRTSEK